MRLKTSPIDSSEAFPSFFANILTTKVVKVIYFNQLS